VQDAQDDAPAAAAYVLFAMQGVQLADPANENVPAAHCEQTVLLVAVQAVDAYEPAGHERHMVHGASPVAEKVAPATQVESVMHALSAVDHEAEAAHVHCVAPVALDTVYAADAGHWMQDVVSYTLGE